MRLAPGWHPWVLSPLALALLLLPFWRSGPLLPAATVLLVLLSLGMAAFFRDPERTVGEGIVAAADGRIQRVEEDWVITFLNVHNVHVIRSPFRGTVSRVERFGGGNAPAFLSRSKHNAGVAVEMETDRGRRQVRLVAGLVARRAVPFVEEGQQVRRGERIGMIRFGSRVDVDLPPDARVRVAPGERVRAGETTLATLGEGPS